ncbi:MAG: hypothetical protein ACJAVR_003699 [Paracoccaceae bacterium]|jgi:hypothetical protein
MIGEAGRWHRVRKSKDACARLCSKGAICGPRHLSDRDGAAAAGITAWLGPDDRIAAMCRGLMTGV